LTVVVFLIGGGASLPAAGEVAESGHGRAFAIAGNLMSPFCPGRLLSECQSRGAFDLREEIATRLDRGESPQAIVDDLVRRYGDGIRGVPGLQGFGLVAWTMPLVLAGGTLAVLVVWLRRSTRLRQAGGPHSRERAALDDLPFAARLDEELRAIDC
jgi:cytochrome c-type biogenesis protein CcmH/NrfF